MDGRPVWLLDVDGVINASRPGWGGPPVRRSVLVAGHSLTLRWEPKLVACIRTLHMAALVEVRWATSWVPWVDRLEELWRLPAMLRAWDGDPLDVAAAKRSAAEGVLASGRRLVWTDDDLDDLCPGAWAGAARALQLAPGDELRTPRAALYVDERMLLVRPESRRGLRPEHLDAIETFVGGGGG